MFGSLTENISKSFKFLKGQSRLTELNVNSVIKEIKKSLLNADVQYKVVKEVIQAIKQEAIGQKVIDALKPDQKMVQIVEKELANMMGGENTELNIRKKPAVILLVGLQGSGKTTFAAKLANHVKKMGSKPLLVAADVYRPAAIEQLSVLAETISVPVYKETGSKDVVAISKSGINFAKENRNDTIIIDTAGRLAIDETLMQEIQNIKHVVKPSEILFVVDSMVGQEAVEVARAFNNAVEYTGVVVTKLDGDTRGGAVLSVQYTTKKPIKFVSEGEKIDDIDIFHPDRMARKILGMGDVTSLVEKLEREFDEEEAKKLERKIKKNSFDLNDFKKQLKTMQKLGGLSGVTNYLPGASKLNVDSEKTNQFFRNVNTMIDSMTDDERTNPVIINQSRKQRISKGSGKSIDDLNRFLKQFDQMKKMMKNPNAMRSIGSMLGGK